MRYLSGPVILRALCAFAAVTWQFGCTTDGGHSPNILSPGEQFGFTGRTMLHPIAGHTCPTSGSIEYLSDITNNVILIYSGKFAGQAPCGQITSGLSNPEGLYVNPKTHDLYVANEGMYNILVFHRGQTIAYNMYADPTLQATSDVTMSNDGTVFASNSLQGSQIEGGSISTWIAGRHGGRWIGNFPMTHDDHGLYITVQKNDTVYYDDIDLSGGGALWSMSCPYGNCGAQTQVLGQTFNNPGGLGSDAANDLLLVDGQPGVFETFELPNPTPKTFPLAGYPRGMAINPLDRHVFISDGSGAGASEYMYPSGNLIGSVPGLGGNVDGIAIDPAHAPR